MSAGPETAPVSSSILAAAEYRGRTTVSERTVRRLAARAAREVDGVADGPEVSARVTGDSAVLRVRLPVAYPTPVGSVTDACRAHLMRRTHELSGLVVPRVDIEVAELVNPVAAARSVR
ncbi:Asp23/Gls24 family envelope stress response protein [Nocardia spumae]|uniref:Asp23/Gls24 family envelope stress response protein n=1 Tax=Nocardia spumae TaxID=2887190 RepID=UPI001D15A23E|nr:Asp23/Gls24 family envelope stress response protein [Nocardia spumae]